MMHSYKTHVEEFISLVKGHDLNAILGDNFRDELWLFDNKSGTQFDDTFLHGCHTVLEGHVLLEFIV